MLKHHDYRETLPWNRRLGVAGMVITAHLALLISAKTPAPPISAPLAAGQSGESMEFVEMAAAPRAVTSTQASPAPVTPKVPPPPKPDQTTPALIEHPETLGLPAPDPNLEPVSVDGGPAPRLRAAMAGTASDDPCHFAQALQGALQADDAVLRALTLIPRESRSVANAVMVWNGQWVTVNALGGDSSLEPVRAAIVKSLSVASADCLTRMNNGPLFITLPSWPETTVLALGSGQWRASDLIAEGAEIEPVGARSATHERQKSPD